MRSWLTVIVVGALLAPVAHAAEQLPVVALTGADGRAVQSDAVARERTWILVYVHSGCASCVAPLAALESAGVGDDRARIAVVVESDDPAVLNEIAGRYPVLAGVTWLGDGTGALGRQVAPQRAAAIIGLQGRTVEWRLAGVLMEAPQVSSVVRAWLGR